MPGLGMRQTWSPRVLFGATAIKGFWLDVSDMSTMFQDAAGTIACAINSPVGLIKDKSGNANDFSQSSSGNRPTLRRDSSNRLYLDFGGTHWLAANLSTTDLGGNLSKTIYAASKFNSASTSYNTLFLMGDIKPLLDGSSFGLSGSGVVLKNSLFQIAYDVQGSTITTNKTILTGVKNSNNLSIYLNGVLDGSASVSAANVTSTTTTIGRILVNPDYNLRGAIYEMVLMATTTRYPQLEKWMSDRMGLVY